MSKPKTSDLSKDDLPDLKSKVDTTVTPPVTETKDDAKPVVKTDDKDASTNTPVEDGTKSPAGDSVPVSDEVKDAVADATEDLVAKQKATEKAAFSKRDGKDHDKQTYHQAKPKPEKAYANALKPTQTSKLLFGCPKSDITRFKGKGPWSTLRVTRKWFDGVEIGDVIDCHGSEKIVAVPTSDTYPKQGAFYCKVKVVGKKLVPSLSAALSASRDNHFIKLGRATSQLEELMRGIYPAEDLAKAGSDPDNGFTILTLEIVE